MSTPTAMAKANARNEVRGTIASRAKLAARVMAAVVIARLARGTAVMMAARSGRARFLPHPACHEEVVVRAERDQQHADAQGDVEGQVRLA